MTRKINIKDLPDDYYKILGINSEEKIWKLSYELNRLLNLNLQRIEKKWENPGKEKKSGTDSLFDLQSGHFQKREAEFLYLDEQTFPKYAVVLCAGAGQILPKPARPFRYFLFLRYNTTGFEDQEWATWMETLKASSVVLTICDLSNLQELKNVLS